MTVSIIPAYRIVTHLARRAKGLPYEDALNALESGLGEYVRAQLAQVHPSLIELATRSVSGQLGDPTIPDLLEQLATLDDAEPREIVEEAIEVASAMLPRPDLSARMFIFPGDGESRVLAEQLGGVLGFSLGSLATLLFVWPGGDWRRNLRYTVVHEYAHLVRNLLFPRGIAAGRLVYTKTQQVETLLDAMIVEGVAEWFAQACIEGARPRWLEATDDAEVSRMWPRVRRRFGVSDVTEIRRFLFGDGDRVPSWTGYAVGYEIVEQYLGAHPDASPASLVSMPASSLYDG